MKIECTLARKGGTFVELDGRTYHFKPDDNLKHVAEVADEDHITRLLAIREGYRVLGDEPPAKPAKPAEPKPADDQARDKAAAAYLEKFGREPAPDLATKAILDAVKKG